MYHKQWWRLISPMALHAGVFHILCNISIQLRVGGYLNLVYGHTKWLTIYILSGIFGELLSCCVMVNSVGVGSSGAIMGILASWVVWIVFRWKKIPPECHRQRYCNITSHQITSHRIASHRITSLTSHITAHHTTLLSCHLISSYVITM